MYKTRDNICPKKQLDIEKCLNNIVCQKERKKAIFLFYKLKKKKNHIQSFRPERGKLINFNVVFSPVHIDNVPRQKTKVKYQYIKSVLKMFDDFTVWTAKVLNSQLS